MLRRICGEGLCARIAGLLVVTGFAIALAFEGLIAMAGAALVLAAGVLFALMLEDSLGPDRKVEQQRNT